MSVESDRKQEALTEFRRNLSHLNASIEQLAQCGVSVEFPPVYAELYDVASPVRVLVAEIIDSGFQESEE